MIAGQAATFSVTAVGAEARAHEWYRNNAAIAGATASSHKTPVTTTNDSDRQCRVTVPDVFGAATSSVATLTVNVAPGGTLLPRSGR